MGGGGGVFDGLHYAFMETFSLRSLSIMKSRLDSLYSILLTTLKYLFSQSFFWEMEILGFLLLLGGTANSCLLKCCWRLLVPQILFFFLQTATVVAAPLRQLCTLYLGHFETQESDQRQLEVEWEVSIKKKISCMVNRRKTLRHIMICQSMTF